LNQRPFGTQPTAVTGADARVEGAESGEDVL
jgi:hypothetical protein